MKNTLTITPVIPIGYTGKDYNKWIQGVIKTRKALSIKIIKLEIN